MHLWNFGAMPLLLCRTFFGLIVLFVLVIISVYFVVVSCVSVCVVVGIWGVLLLLVVVVVGTRKDRSLIKVKHIHGSVDECS